MAVTDAPKARTARAALKRPAAKRAPAKPPAAKPAAERVKKTKLTLAQAADQWEAAKREMDRCKTLLEESAPILLEYFERTSRRVYKHRIALVFGSSRLILDQRKVREFLGARLPEFQTRSTPGPSLSLLDKSPRD